MKTPHKSLSFALNFASCLLILFCLESFSLIGKDDLPIVPRGFAVDVVAKEPMVSNPCVMAFDRLGRICVAQGPQWRGPTPETPGDRVDILIDKDGDGIADHRRTFADGFNCIQGLAWCGKDLWVANAPDLTVVRDTNGDDQADEYVRVYTGLGNLEHSLHGLNFGPDGKLYMSKGNSKGYNRLDQLAPKAFRDLWGLPAPRGAPDYPVMETFTKSTYQRKYHTPQDDWGQQGGILRCDPYQEGKLFAQNLEIVSRGFRNPWDIAFDDGFNWLGTDNDQSQGDKIFAPFPNAHFGWGHPWSFHWTGTDHLPSVPASAPLFEGSGTGVIYYSASQFPPEYQNLFFINDWMGKQVYAFRPKWDGALMKCEQGFPPTFIHAGGGRSLPSSDGRVFEPTDIEVGPDGTLYILSWGHGYGGTLQEGKQIDAGRVYRIRCTDRPLSVWKKKHRIQPHAEWSMQLLFEDLHCSIPAFRVNAQTEFLRRGKVGLDFLKSKWEGGGLSQSAQTWTLWTIGRYQNQPSLNHSSLNQSDRNHPNIEEWFIKQANSRKASLNTQIQLLRIFAFRRQPFSKPTDLPIWIKQALKSPHARLRQAAVLAVSNSGYASGIDLLIELAAKENDRIVFYSTWNALRKLATIEQKLSWLKDIRAGVRLASILGLFQDDLISGERAKELQSDSDSRISQLVNDWLVKTGNGKPLVQFDPPAGGYSETINVIVKPTIPGVFLTYTLDGSRPSMTSPRVQGPIRISRSTELRVAVNRGKSGGNQLTSAKYVINQIAPYQHRTFVRNVRAVSGQDYELDWTGLRINKRQYTDRNYYITKLPTEVTGLPFIRAANADDRSSGDRWLSMTTTESVDLIIGVDARNNAPLSWMKIGKPGGFEDMKLEVATTDAIFKLYRRHFPAGEIVLGGNTNNPKTDSGRGHYIVIFDRRILHPSDSAEPVTVRQALAKMETANAERGRELFLHPKGAGCFKCHRMEGLGSVLAPDLSDIGDRTKTAQVLIESILEPSKVITEGFAQQKVSTFDGKFYSGAVVEESGQSIKMVMTDATTKVIKKSDIEERKGSRLSPMPSGFGELMSAQQVADIAVWLMEQKVVGDKSGFSFRVLKNKMEINLGKQKIATYLMGHDRLTRRALVNVKTPSGIQVTRNFPPRKPEDVDPGYTHQDGIIHPVMHPGIWIGFGDVNGNDYWRLQSIVEFVGFTENPTGNSDSGSFAAHNRFRSKDGKRIVCDEFTKYRFQQVPEGLLLHIEATYASDQKDFYFGDQEESGLAVRVASPIRVQGGNGTIINNRGERNGAQIWGKKAKWFDYFGTIDGRQIGLMVVANPKNPRPSWLHARDYGVIVTNPFPKQPRERREPFVKTHVRVGEKFELSYAILIHDRPANQPLDREKAAQMLLNSFE